MKLHRRSVSVRHGFTIVELLMVVAAVVILVTITLVVYRGINYRASQSVTLQTVADALRNLQVYHAVNRNYPANIADTNYKPPQAVGVVLYTNTPQIPIYENLTSDENAQLFINSCNGVMPVVDNSVTYNNACTYAGNNLHISGTQSSNVVIQGPAIHQSQLQLTCGAVCDAAAQTMASLFTSQGGHFPLSVPKNSATLPKPTLVTIGTEASRFCVEGRYGTYSDIIYHASSDNQRVITGPCPSDPELHYP